MDNDIEICEPKKNFSTREDLIRQLQENDPTFIAPPQNVVPLRPVGDIGKMMPITFGDLKSDVPPPIEFVCSPIMSAPSITFVYAATGVGKTLFTLNLAYAIAGGGHFLKYTCPVPRRVLYVDGEMPYNQLHSRLMDIARQQGELDFEQNLMILTPDKVLPYRIPMMDDPAGQEMYNKWIELLQIEVIVFDNLSMLSSFDENKSNEWKPTQEWLRHLRTSGITVIVVHHAGKDPTGYRGTSRMLDCVDAAISLQPVLDELEEGNVGTKKFKIVYKKARNFGGKDAAPFEAHLSLMGWSQQSLDLTIEDRVLECISAKMSQREMAKELNLSQTKINRIVKSLAKSGRLPG